MITANGIWVKLRRCVRHLLGRDRVTSARSGNWSDPQTWDRRVPQDGDRVVIADGHSVAFDVDQSQFEEGTHNLTVLGQMTVSQEPGQYYLKAPDGIDCYGHANMNINCGPSNPMTFDFIGGDHGFHFNLGAQWAFDSE